MSLKPVKQSYLSAYFLIPMIVLLGCVALAMWAGQACGALPDCIDSTCRVTPGDGGSGTGSVFLIEDGYVYVLTNAHVATTIRVGLEFWSDGHLSRKIYGSTVLRSVSRDVAVIAVETSVFGRFLPTAIPLAPLETELYQGQAVFSVGCANGSWATAWRGHVHEQPGDGRVAFNPTPALGRSGSAIYDSAGEHIVALLNLQRWDKPKDQGGKPIWGIAVDIENIYAAIYGSGVKTSYNVTDRERFWPPQKQAQECGPQGCPTPQWRGSPQSGRGYILPYRQKQQQIDRRQDKGIGDLYPTKPFKVPDPELKIEIKPAPASPKWKPPVVKKKGFPMGVFVVLMLIASAIGCVIGLVVQWKKTYKKM